MGLILIASLTILAYTIYGAIYRLYLSPIAHIPGPKLAALTRLYEAYYDLYLGGQYTFHLISLHKTYGPIIRISPWELHISDPDFYHEIYVSSASGKKRDKYEWFSKSFGLDDSVFGTVPHNLHRLRRTALNPYFSMASVRRLQPLIDERVGKLLDRIRGFRGSGEVFPASLAYAALTNDIVMEYCFARCDHRIEAPDFDPSYRDASFFGSTAGSFMKHAPWLNEVFKKIPDSLAKFLHPAMAEFAFQRHFVTKQITSIITGQNLNYKDAAHPTIFHSILTSKLPSHEKSITRLSDDAHVLTMAGTLTTAWLLEVVTFHLLSSPRILRKLREELRDAIPDAAAVVDGGVPLPVLEKLPYLNAVVKEGLRLSYGVSCRLARSDPEGPLVYTDTSGEEAKTWIIPPGTPVGMTGVHIHHDETIFPDSHSFIPERWMVGKEGEEATTTTTTTELERYLVSFSGGSRQCLGINLAYAEAFICLARLWRCWGSKEVRMLGDVGVLELFETGLVDVEIVADAFLPLVQKGSKGIRLKVLE